MNESDLDDIVDRLYTLQDKARYDQADVMPDEPEKSAYYNGKVTAYTNAVRIVRELYDDED